MVGIIRHFEDEEVRDLWMGILEWGSFERIMWVLRIVANAGEDARYELVWYFSKR